MSYIHRSYHVKGDKLDAWLDEASQNGWELAGIAQIGESNMSYNFETYRVVLRRATLEMRT